MTAKRRAEENHPSIVLVGNANVGKSVIFSQLTGRYVTVSNYPGTTVDIMQGTARIRDTLYDVIDTPGINSLSSISEDERVARDVLLDIEPEVTVQVGDAKNLERTLLLWIQLAEMGLKLVLDLNMADEAARLGYEIDGERLAGILGIPVVSTIAVLGRGLRDLREAVPEARTPRIVVRYPEAVEEAVLVLQHLLEKTPFAARLSALLILCGDSDMIRRAGLFLSSAGRTQINRITTQTQAGLNYPLQYIITQARMKEVKRIVALVQSRKSAPLVSQQELANSLTMSPFTGIPVFLIVLYLVYKLVGGLGAGTAVDYLELVVFGKYINPRVINLVQQYVGNPLVQDMLVGEYGIFTMGLTYALAIVLPVVGAFFLAFSILEDSGYLPRLAVMVNRIFAAVGLSGRAVLPLILGFGCDTMATLTTRILDTPRERIITTLLLALGIPCSAQLGVVLGLLSHAGRGAVLTVAVVVAAQLVLVGWLAGRIIPGRRSDFIQEIPPLRIPQLKNILVKTVVRVEWFLLEAVPIFVLGTLLLFCLDESGLLLTLEEAARPVVSKLLGLPEGAVVAFILGFLRRDYGAAGLFALARGGELNPFQIIVASTVIILFVPCIANFLVMIKERGIATAVLIFLFIIPYAVFVGTILNRVLSFLSG